MIEKKEVPSAIRTESLPVLPLHQDYALISKGFQTLRTIVTNRLKKAVNVSGNNDAAQQLKEVKRHLTHFSAGIELLMKMVNQGDFQQIGVILPSLILDGGIQIEQLLNIPYALADKRRPDHHHLIERAKETKVWEKLKPETQKQLTDIRLAVVWSRYPEAASANFDYNQNKFPNVLKLLQLSSQYSQGNISKEVILKLINDALEFSQRNLAAFKNILEVVSEIKMSAVEEKQFAEMDRNLEDLKISLPKQVIFHNKDYQEDRISTQLSSSIKAMEDAISRQSKAMKKDLDDPISPLNEALGHLIRIKNLWSIVKREPNPRYAAWIFRNALNIRYVFEQIYMARLIIRGDGRIATHNLQEYHEQLEDPKELRDTVNFSYHKGIHYSSSTKADGFGGDRLLRLYQFEKEIKQYIGAEEGFSHSNSYGKTELKRLNIAQEVEQLLVEALPLLEKHIELVSSK